MIYAIAALIGFLTVTALFRPARIYRVNGTGTPEGLKEFQAAQKEKADAADELTKNWFSKEPKTNLKVFRNR